MKNSKPILILFAIMALSCVAEPINCGMLRSQLTAAEASIPTDTLRVAVLGEPMNFADFSGRHPSYRAFAVTVSNNWCVALSNFCAIATNETERLLLIGVGQQFDEDFYIDYMGTLSDLRTNNVITAEELQWAASPIRAYLLTCILRRYSEPKVIQLVNKYRVSRPHLTDYWNDILSGAAYTNYLEEVEMGLWQ